MVYDKKNPHRNPWVGRISSLPGLGLTKTQGKKATKLDQGPGGNPGGLLGY